ncbi:hypothetical protein CR513_36358, partial [Mucuna pruriens]
MALSGAKESGISGSSVCPWEMNKLNKWSFSEQVNKQIKQLRKEIIQILNSVPRSSLCELLIKEAHEASLRAFWVAKTLNILHEHLFFSIYERLCA